MLSLTHSEAYYEGSVAFLRGEQKFENPHTRGTEAARDWDEGWQSESEAHEEDQP